MSGGELVVLDAQGRPVKQYALAAGMATLGKDQRCDIRVMRPSVARHHATIVVHANQTVVQNLSDEGSTLVNGSPVSVAALCHGDVITIGGRQIRWEYHHPNSVRPSRPAPGPAVVCAPLALAPGKRGRSRRRASAAPALTPPLRAALQAHHRASMPANAGGKQVAIVQPQRRDNTEHHSPSPLSPRRARGAASLSPAGGPPPHTTHTTHTTKATLWIESRKTSPRKHARASVPAGGLGGRGGRGRRGTPLRLAALRRAQSQRLAGTSVSAVTKISPPATVDHTKQTALMLMAGRARLSPGPRALPRPRPLSLPRPRPRYTAAARRAFKRHSRDDSAIEINDSETHEGSENNDDSLLTNSGSAISVITQTPIKSAMKDPKRNSRKMESIKFDLSNLETRDDDEAVTVRDSSQHNDELEEDLTLYYSDSPSPPSPKSPSPRRSIHSRSSRMLEKVGTPIPEEKHSSQNVAQTPGPSSPSARRSLRGSLLVKRALDASTSKHEEESTSRTFTDNSLDTTVESAFRTRTITPRSRRKVESYSIVDLVSADSGGSVYDSAGSTRTSSVAFGSPRPTDGRKTRSRSTISNANVLGSSTPYVAQVRRVGRSTSSPDITTSSNPSTKNLRRSKSLTTPENSYPHISVNSTRISRTSRSRSRISESDLQYISSKMDDDNDSPKSSRRAIRPERSHETTVSNRGSRPQDSMDTTQYTDATLSPEISKASVPKRSTRSHGGIDTLSSILEMDTTISSDHSKSNVCKNDSTSQIDKGASKSDLGSEHFSISIKCSSSVNSSTLSSKSIMSKRGSRKHDLEASKSVEKSSSLTRSSRKRSPRKTDIDNTKSFSENDKSPKSPKSKHHLTVNIDTSNVSPRGSRSRGDELPKSPKSMSKNNLTIGIDTSIVSPRGSRKIGSSMNSKSIVENNKSPRVLRSPRLLKSPKLLKSVASKRSFKPKTSFEIANSILEKVWTLGSDTSHRNISDADDTPTSVKNRRSGLAKRKADNNVTLSPEKYNSTPPRRNTRFQQSSFETRHTENNVTLSPRSGSTNTPKSSPNKTSTPKKSGNSVQLSEAISPEDGTITPENRTSPKDEGTPVLNIQKLLDSSITSVSPSQKRTKGNKRKTIGTIRLRTSRERLGLSKSLSDIGGRSLRALKRAPIAADASDGEKVTPKSAVQVIQQDVKQKHSTAKKPVSKRSLIDNLNESDIVKQLFNSPVKRKLSKSMTEFSRTKLFDDDVVAPKRPTRKTIAATVNAQNDSLLERSEEYTTSQFVSTIRSESSPSFTGLKELFKINAPKNDLRDVTGVKNVMKTPNTRSSVRNDLTKVSGVKRLFAKTDNNTLSDVRVKKLFTKQPRNDLRNVSGVKSLFQTQNKNDLSDVRGVKKLFQRKSATNDLRNVSGVKTIMQAKSPRNDLTDIRGVKSLFRKDTPQNELEISGVKELFNESRVKGSEELFDELIGKPRIRAVYSKSFLPKPSKKKSKQSMSKSLSIPVDVMANNVEDWIQEELQKRFKKNRTDTLSNSAPNPNESRDKANRELTKLVTDTIEGGSPICDSRVRKSTLLRIDSCSGEKKSVSALYSPRKLPIKKRSLVEVSAETSREGSVRKRRLPIKKREVGVVHSTPVRGGGGGGAALPRLSPIILDRPRQLNAASTAAGLTQTEAQAEPKTRGRPLRTPRGTEPETPALVSSKSSSPQKRQMKNLTDSKLTAPAENQGDVSAISTGTKSPRARSPNKGKSRPGSPLPKENINTEVNLTGNVGTRRARKIVNLPQTENTNRRIKASADTNTQEPFSNVSSSRNVRRNRVTEPTSIKKKQSSVIIIKKPPVLSPSKPFSDSASENQKENKRVLTRRQKNASRPDSPAPTRGKVASGSGIAVEKRKRNKTAEPVNENKPVPVRRGRKVEIKISDEPAVDRDEPVRKGRKIADAPRTTEVADTVQTRRGRKRVAEIPVNIQKPSRRGRKAEQEIVNAVVEAKAEPVGKGKKNEKNAEDVERTNSRGVSKTRKNEKIQEESKPEIDERGKSTKEGVEEIKSKTVRRGGRSQKPVEENMPEPVKRGRQAARDAQETQESKPEVVLRNRRVDNDQGKDKKPDQVTRSRAGIREGQSEPARRGKKIEKTAEVPPETDSLPVRRGRKTPAKATVEDEESKVVPVKRGRRAAKITDNAEKPSEPVQRSKQAKRVAGARPGSPSPLQRRRNAEKEAEPAEVPAKRGRREVQVAQTQTSAPSIVRLEKEIVSERSAAATRLRSAVRGAASPRPHAAPAPAPAPRSRSAIRRAYAPLSSPKPAAETKRRRGRAAPAPAGGADPLVLKHRDSGCVLSDTAYFQDGEGTSSSGATSRCDVTGKPRARRRAKNIADGDQVSTSGPSSSSGRLRGRVPRSPVYKPAVLKRTVSSKVTRTAASTAIAAGGRSRRR